MIRKGKIFRKEKAMEFPEFYISELKKTLEALNLDRIKEISEVLIRANGEEKTIFICGMGGSASTASHFANDLSKMTISPGRKRFRVIALTDNVSLITAWTNDRGSEMCFVEPLKNLFHEGDVLIAISGSGNSASVLNAVRYVNAHKGTTIGLTGFSGGGLGEIAHISIVVKSDNMQRIEDGHLILSHLISSFICDLLKG